MGVVITLLATVGAVVNDEDAAPPSVREAKKEKDAEEAQKSEVAGLGEKGRKEREGKEKEARKDEERERERDGHDEDGKDDETDEGPKRERQRERG